MSVVDLDSRRPHDVLVAECPDCGEPNQRRVESAEPGAPQRLDGRDMGPSTQSDRRDRGGRPAGERPALEDTHD